jgi:hypothetical protein
MPLSSGVYKHHYNYMDRSILCYTLLLLFAGILLGCNKDKNNNTTLTGTWIVDSVTIKDRMTRGVVLRDTTHVMKMEEYVMIFYADDSYCTYPFYGGRDTGTYKINGGQLACTQILPGMTYDFTYDYVISGQNMKLVNQYHDTLNSATNILYARKKGN